MNYNIAVLEGDGIGPEIVQASIRVMEAVGEQYGHSFSFKKYLMGGCAYDATGKPLPQETVDGCLASDSVLLGAVGGPKWDTLPGTLRPEAALLGIRKALGLYANIRPAQLFDALSSACPLRADIADKGIDLVIIRELTGGLYFGERGRRSSPGGEEAFDTEAYNETEITRIAKVAFELAQKRKKTVISVDKANVLESSRLWREVVHTVARDYPDVTCTDMLVDNAAMQLVRNPSQFDVVVTSNLFGDILSDEASMLTGSIGLLSSASLGEGTRGMYEPIHGTAPDIAGKGVANPIATILSCALMLRMSFGLEQAAAAVENAVAKVLESGARTADIAREGETTVGCNEMTQLILTALH
ncbi:MAG: 3-isopropylmalate dehydrogenase [Acetanaerobacterium sp.]